MTNPLAAIPAPTSPDEDDGGQFIRTTTDLYPALDPIVRAGFDRQCPAAKADDLGTRTRAPNVLHDAERFARVMHGALSAPRGNLSYTPVRFRYYLEGVQGLRGAIEVDQAQPGGVAAAGVNLVKAREAALTAREVAHERLQQFAEGDDVRLEALSRAYGTTKDDEAILRALKTLADLVEDWLASTDPIDQAMAKSLGVDDDLRKGTADARTTLSDARAAIQAEGPKTQHRDSRETNRIEGRVLFEMRLAMRLFDNAHHRDNLSPRLVPSTGTRHVLARNRKKEEPAVAAKPAVPPAPTAGADPAPAATPAADAAADKK